MLDEVEIKKVGFSANLFKSFISARQGLLDY